MMKADVLPEKMFVINQIIIMIIINRLLSPFAVFFHRNSQTRPLPKVKQALIDFLKRKIRREEFQQSFSAYQAYLLQTLEDNPGQDKTKVDVFDLCTKIHSIYQFPSKKLNKIHNRWADECLQYAQQQTPTELVKVLSMLQRVNKGKASAIFLKQQQKIFDYMRKSSPNAVVELLVFLWKANINIPIFRETSLQILYPELNNLNTYQIKVLLQSLAHSKKYINKQFIQKLADRILTLYKCNNIEERNLPPILASISEIQKNLHTRSIYIDQLDQLYERALPHVFMTAQHLPEGQLNLLVSAVRRSKYYDETILIKIGQIALNREIKQLSDQEVYRSPHKFLSMKVFFNILHTHAVYNYHHPQLKSFALKLLNILKAQERPLEQNIFFNLLWTLCVLYTRKEIAPLYPLIERYIESAQSVNIAQASNIYYCYLYLRSMCPQFSYQRQKIHSLMSGYHLETHTSNTQKQVYQTLLSLGVPCIPQYNLNNLVCDILIPEWNSLKNVIIEVHGFRHFCRNVKMPTGSNKLKEKIISAQMYRYYYITIDQWFLAEEKKVFLVEFLSHLQQLSSEVSERRKSLEELTPQTAKSIKGRPRKFRTTSKKCFLE